MQQGQFPTPLLQRNTLWGKLTLGAKALLPHILDQTSATSSTKHTAPLLHTQTPATRAAAAGRLAAQALFPATPR